MDGYEFEKAELDALQRVVDDSTAEPMVISFSLLEHITESFSAENMIGEGGFATVYLGKLPNGSRIAVKLLHPFHSDESAIHNEVDITIKAAHKNIVRLIGYCNYTRTVTLEHKGKTILAEERKELLCTEYVSNGTLERHIKDKFPEGLDWNQRYRILKGICRALSYLHDDVRVLHGDINPSNVLIEDNFEPKLFDFGLSECPDEEEDWIYRERLFKGTVGYLAPEFYLGRLSFSADIYGLGVMIVELLTGSKKGYGVVDEELKRLRKRLVKVGVFSSWEDKYQQVRTCLEIGYKCMIAKPDKRPTALEIIQLLDETESTKDSGSSGHAPLLWQVIYRCTGILRLWSSLQRVEFRDLFTEVCVRLEDTARDFISLHGWQHNLRIGPPVF